MKMPWSIMSKPSGLMLGLTCLLTGCASFSGAENSENIEKLQPGMSEAQVLYTLGTPDSVRQTSESGDQWIYEFKKQDKAGQNMFVAFEDGKLIKTGALNGREIAAANENSTPGVCTHRYRKDTQIESLCTR